MKLEFTDIFRFHPEFMIRRCGYGQITNRRTGEVSYVRRLGSGLYPRFHAYIEKQADGFQINLHLDQKQPSYGKHTAHSGEYDGEVVKREGERIKIVIEGMKA